MGSGASVMSTNRSVHRSTHKLILLGRIRDTIALIVVVLSYTTHPSARQKFACFGMSNSRLLSFHKLVLLRGIRDTVALVVMVLSFATNPSARHGIGCCPMTIPLRDRDANCFHGLLTLQAEHIVWEHSAFSMVGKHQEET